MKEVAYTRHELANRLQSIPANQIKQAVIRLLDTEDAELTDLEQILPLTEKDESNLEELSPAEKAAAFRAWAESHRRGLPLLSDEAISRESIYSNERL